MTTQSNHSLILSKFFSQLCGLIAATSGVVAIVGWLMGWRILSGIRADYIPMAPNTALSFIVLGVSLYALITERKTALKLSRIGPAVIFVLSLIRFIEISVNINLNVDRWIFQVPLEKLGLIPVGRMALPTALNFLFASVALFLASSLKKRWSADALTRVLAGLTTFIGLAFCLGYIYGAPLLYGGTTVPMALNTAISFFVLGLGLVINNASHDIAERKRSAEALRKAHDGLEVRVAERTAELAKANEALQAEIIEHKRAEEKIMRLYSLQTVIRKINQTMLKIKNKPELFHEVCYLLTKVEDIKFVWIGLVERGSFEVIPVAQAGFEDGYLSSIRVKWDDTEYGRGPTGTAIKTGQPFIMRDIENDPRFSPWRKDAVKRGYASSIALPLEYKGEIIGALNVYSEKRDAFGDEEAGFLIEVTGDIAVGIKSVEMEESLLESKKRYKKLVESVTDYIYTVEIKNGEPISTKHGPGCSAVTGYSQEEFEADSHLWYRIIFEEDRKAVIGQAEKILAGEFAQPIEHRIIHKDGSIRWIKNTPVPLFDEDRQLVAYDGMIADITEMKQLEGQLRHAQKMEAVGQLAGGVAHDFNNILTAIISYGNILKMKIKDDDPLKIYADQILSSSERAANLIQGLLTFSRKQIISLRPVKINDIVKRVEKLLLRIIGEDIELKTILTDSDLTVLADSGQIEQVLMNLATNARDAMPDGGVLTISTELFEMESEFIKTYGYGKPRFYALISAADTGAGIKEEIRERIFEPFFTTKEFGKGTGLGLSIVYGILKQHDGYINFYSEPGKGTTFKIYLPIVKSPVEDERATAPSLMERGGETVLVAEDEEEARKPIKDVLELFGYEVIEAVDGEDAIDKFMNNKDNIRLLILDVVMPKKSAKEAYDEIKKVRPDIKALFISGYTENVIHKKGILTEGLEFIFKPLSPKQLLNKVREMLGR